MILSTTNTTGAKIRAVISFLSSKVLAYSILGFLLGLAGNFFSLSPAVSGILNLLIAGFMIGVALEALKVHPFFRHFLLQPPKFVRKLVRENSKKEGVLAGVFLGASTVLIPCGTTQAMMALAVASQQPLTGMATLSAFTLGTVPLFLLFGLTASKLNGKYAKWMQKVIATILLVLAGYTILTSLRLFGINPQLLPVSTTNTKGVLSTKTDTKLQTVEITLTDGGYKPQRIVIEKGIPVEVTVINEEARGCIQSFVIPELKVREVVPLGKSIKIRFTPQRSGKIGFTCSMGMYYGEFLVQ